jgi:FAD:protein FMN transferase
VPASNAAPVATATRNVNVATATGNAAQIVARTRAMATDITLKIALHNVEPVSGDLERALAEAVNVFAEVDRTCSRFKPDSPLSRANAAPELWHRLPPLCFDSISEAFDAYQRTQGLFDPRVLADLVRLGYDRSLPFATSSIEIGAGSEYPAGSEPTTGSEIAPTNAWSLIPWRPLFRPANRQVRLAESIDLGGIGKGLSVRWARDRLLRTTNDFLVDAGGDCYCSGRAPDGGPWSVGIEDPTDPGELVATVDLRDRACTTSSIRLRKWTVDGRPVHHIIDPRTREPGGAGLLSVTVVGDDPAHAEVASKTLFLAGSDHIASHACAAGTAALWVTDQRRIFMTGPMEEYVRWLRR